MGALHWRKRLIVGGALLFLLGGGKVCAVTPQSTLVVYNASSAEGVEIANYYAQKHSGVQLLGLTGVTTAEQVTDDYYRSVIRPQILTALDSSIDTIVTTKGLPLRIYTDNANPGTYTDPYGVSRTPYSAWWKQYSSLESELTRIEQISTWQQMGDQVYFSQSGLPNYPNPSCNPYYGVSGSFQYSDYVYGYGGIRLTARLDGFTTADVKSSIDRAQQAFLLPGANSSQYVVMDDDPNSVGSDRMTYLKTVLDNKPQPYVYDNTDAAITTASRPVIGYVSHGVNDGAGGLESGYIADQLDFTLANGAAFLTHESFNAYSFVEGNNISGQGLVAEWLAAGGTVGVGNVYEPMSGTCYEANEDQMFAMLLEGYTWAEAAWSSIQQLSYVTTVVGDPLMTWKTLVYGDANKDGLVGSADLALLAAHWGETGASGGYMWGYGDFNGDGLVGSADLAYIAAHWGEIASWAGGGATGEPLDLSILTAVPEPSTSVLAIGGLMTLLGRYARRCFRSTQSQRPKDRGVRSAETMLLV